MNQKKVGEPEALFEKRKKVIVQTGRCIYCTDPAKERIQHASSLSRSEFDWLAARNSEGI